jgi:hypothetical protein
VTAERVSGLMPIDTGIAEKDIPLAVVARHHCLLYAIRQSLLVNGVPRSATRSSKLSVKAIDRGGVVSVHALDVLIVGVDLSSLFVRYLLVVLLDAPIVGVDFALNPFVVLLNPPPLGVDFPLDLLVVLLGLAVVLIDSSLLVAIECFDLTSVVGFGLSDRPFICRLTAHASRFTSPGGRTSVRLV